ncbi:glycosyl hydrolase [Agriterribacter sp.]|uniref:glycosyl hydrolase n=1 Tax=Agriterribacter sp. TaxID=2821509 RepID=UPI002C8C39F2|nr:glycosyl hydrolase [Agriterribacter sp.]HRO47116.1 glycosyl hydrolase [Agriterribacter sp.]HRQ17873.1 glycosyl hydrolase [Agriterribacter sp.]
MNSNFLLISIIMALNQFSCKNNIPINTDFISAHELEQGFKNSPDSVKPWVYWYWISDNNTKDGITKDLEAMAEVGIGEAMIGNIGYEGMPYGEIKTLSEEWWQLLEHAVREGKRTGVNIGLFNSPGWSQSGGPWVKPEHSMRYLLSHEIEIEGGKKIAQAFERYSDTYQDVRVLAFPVPENDNLKISSLNPKIKVTPDLKDALNLSDGSLETFCLFKNAGSAKQIVIDFEIEELFTARSLRVFHAGIEFAVDIDVHILENGSYKSIRKFRYDRSNSRVNVGPMRFGPVAISLPTVSSKSFRFILSDFNLRNYFSIQNGDISDVGFAEIELSAVPRIEDYVEKQLGKMCQIPFPTWFEYQWELREEGSDTLAKISPENVIDISKYVKEDTLTWNSPPGNWIIMRIGSDLTGARNAQAAPYATGWEVDKMNKNHLRHHFNQYVLKLLKRLSIEERKAFKHVVLDSYEQGSQNWTDDMIEDFRAKYSYDPLPWLPVLSGRIVGSTDQSDRFLWDLRRFVADRIAYHYVGAFRDICQENGLRIWLENYGHWGFPSEFLLYGGQSHDIGGEFWNEGELGNTECRAASSAAHIYGKRIVSAESYTSAGLAFQRHPTLLKKRGDWSFTEGINQVVLHLYIHQPYEERNPGINAWFGTEFNRKNTWFKQSKYWIDYQRRCMFMLRRGLPINDLCYFIGEDVPKMTGVRIPEVPKGYSFDYINADVILNHLSVIDGNLVLPDGMSYKMLVLPPVETMRPELLEKIQLLCKQGAAIYGAPPFRSPSLKNFPTADKKVETIANELWTKNKGQKGSKYKGGIIDGVDIQDALNQIKTEPDIIFPDDLPLLWVHRRLNDTDIYFISNQSENKLKFDATFRVNGKQPEFWDPIDGNIRDLEVFSKKKSGTEISLELPPQGSAFIVFRKPVRYREEIGDNFPLPTKIVKVEKPWQVTFDKIKDGSKTPIYMADLKDWTDFEEEQIRYYSGQASYKNSFYLNNISPEYQFFINLGKVNVMAEVKVNGVVAGGVWTDPWKLNITNLVKAGNNTIEINVVNNWINRLIGDTKLPTEKRTTWVNENPAKPTDSLQPSGLAGPVAIEIIKY